MFPGKRERGRLLLREDETGGPRNVENPRGRGLSIHEARDVPSPAGILFNDNLL